MLTDKSFENLSDSVVGIAESFTLRVLKRIAHIAKKLAADPEFIFNINQVISEIESDHNDYVQQSRDWVDETLPIAYLRGLKESEAELKRLGVDLESAIPIASGQGGSISPRAAKILSNYPQHHTMYSVFQDSAYNDFFDTRVPVVRDTRGKLRELIILSSEQQYREADDFTRRQFSQDLVNRFADDNIAGITYANGRTVNLDSYAEVVARSQTGNAAREASMRRQQEYGFDLVRISVHYPTSDLCEPYQGHVFSISGESEQYPSLDDAISGGLYHSNCYSGDTEVYTKEGWKFFTEINRAEKILSLNPDTLHQEYVGYDRFIEKESDYMVQFRGNSELRVTPNHRMFSFNGRWFGFVNAGRLINVQSLHYLDRDLHKGYAFASLEKSKEKVYCVTLERNHIMFVRRNGKTTWSGNCKHFQNPYFPGVSPKQEIRQEELGKKENRKRYELEQKQRYNERMIKKWKRREATALTDAEAKKASQKVSDWQSRNRELVKEHDFLRRKYYRESVNA